MGQDKTGAAWTGEGTGRKMTGWDGMGKKDGTGKHGAIKNGMGQGETGKDNTGDLGRSDLTQSS